MAPTRHNPTFTASDYLAWEAEQTERHEFVGGAVYSMAGAEDRHVMVSGNVYMALRQHLSGSPCRTYMADMRLLVAASKSYFYPDVLVTRSENDANSPLVKTEPKLIVEVLSPSTAAYDRGMKFTRYRQLPSLQETVLVDIHERIAEVYRLGADGLWVPHPFDKHASVTLASVALTITPGQLFADVPELLSVL